MPEDSVGGVRDRLDPVVTQGRSSRTVTPAIAAALVVLAASFALSVAFVLANGGLDLPAAQRLAEHGSPSLSAPIVSPSAFAQASPEPSETGGSAVSPAPSATEAPPSAAAPVASATSPPTARPSSNRYDLLTRCPTTPDCWTYVVRQGDNLFSIANYFGVSLKAVEARNPWTKTTALVAGQKLLLPTPTR